jgi:hypothetical protein
MAASFLEIYLLEPISRIKYLEQPLAIFISTSYLPFLFRVSPVHCHPQDGTAAELGL